MLQNAPTSLLLPTILQCTYNSKSITIRQESETTKTKKIKNSKVIADKNQNNTAIIIVEKKRN